MIGQYLAEILFEKLESEGEQNIYIYYNTKLNYIKYKIYVTKIYYIH